MNDTITAHTEDGKLFMLQGKNTWVTLTDIKDTAAFKIYLENLQPHAKQIIQNAIHSLNIPVQNSLTFPKPLSSYSVPHSPIVPIPLAPSVDLPYSSPLINSSISTNSSPQEPKKKKRGRPKKSTTDQDSAEPKTKRGRGRPPKPKSDTDTAAPTQVKRGRGRPPKSKEELPSVQNSLDENSINSTFSTSNELNVPQIQPGFTNTNTTGNNLFINNHLENYSSPEKPKRPRGRPKSSSNTPKDFIEDDLEVGAKRKRGRPRKNPLETPQLQEDGTPKPKRGRGRPKKVQKIDESTDVTISQIKRGRGRPPKNSSFSLDDQIVQKRPKTKRKSNNEDFDITDDSDDGIIPQTDSDEENGILIIDTPSNFSKKNFLYPKDPGDRGLSFYRKKRVHNTLIQNKVLIKEQCKLINSEEREKFTPKEIQFLNALQCYLPNISILKIVPDTNDLLCPSCSRRICHSFCSLFEIMKNVHDTKTWMENVSWCETNFTITLQPEPKIWEERIINFFKKDIKLENKSKFYLENTSVIQIITANAVKLWCFTQNLNVKDVHRARLQRSIHRLLTFSFDCMTCDDFCLAMKLCKLLLLFVSESDSKSQNLSQLNEFWKKVNISPTSDIKTNTSDVNIISLVKLFSFTRDLFYSFGLPHKNSSSSSSSSSSNDISLYTKEQKEDIWGINFKYVENATDQPLVNDKKCALYCIVSSKNDPETILVSLLRKIIRAIPLNMKKISSNINDKQQQLVEYLLTDTNDETQITCVADNWLQCNQIHLYLKITSTDIPEKISLLKKEISKNFHFTTSIEKHLSVLHFTEYEKNIDGINYKFSTGDGTIFGSEEISKFPSTLCIGIKDNEEISRCLLTYSHNEETMVHGPTIQYIAVKNSYRNQGYASKLLNVIKFDFLSFWTPDCDSFILFASNIVSAHNFFRKQNFQFYDHFQEEAHTIVYHPPVHEDVVMNEEEDNYFSCSDMEDEDIHDSDDANDGNFTVDPSEDVLNAEQLALYRVLKSSRESQSTTNNQQNNTQTNYNAQPPESKNLFIQESTPPLGEDNQISTTSNITNIPTTKPVTTNLSNNSNISKDTNSSIKPTQIPSSTFGIQSNLNKNPISNTQPTNHPSNTINHTNIPNKNTNTSNQINEPQKLIFPISNSSPQSEKPNTNNNDSLNNNTSKVLPSSSNQTNIPTSLSNIPKPTDKPQTLSFDQLNKTPMNQSNVSSQPPISYIPRKPLVSRSSSIDSTSIKPTSTLAVNTTSVSSPSSPTSVSPTLNPQKSTEQNQQSNLSSLSLAPSQSDDNKNVVAQNKLPLPRNSSPSQNSATSPTSSALNARPFKLPTRSQPAQSPNQVVQSNFTLRFPIGNGAPKSNDPQPSQPPNNNNNENQQSTNPQSGNNLNLASCTNLNNKP